MPRRNLERKTSGYCKIRKRVSSSSSSAPSSPSCLVKSYRLKRANSSTQLYIWNMDLRSPSVAKGKEAQMSARRLASTLWDVNGGAEEESEEENENFKGRHSHMLDHSCSPLCKKSGSKQSRHRRRSSEKLELIEYSGHGGSTKVASHSGLDTSPSIASRLRDVSTSLTTSKELVKVLFKMWSQEEQNSSNLTLVSALRVEIDRARHQVDRLMHEKRYTQRDIDSLLTQFACEKAVSKSKEKERISNAVFSVSKELEIEKKLRRQTERLNKTLGKELADTKDQLHKAMEELGCERRARQILEQTCDELAVGLGEDGNEVEEMKRECDKVREETERERQMLQLADVLREERVQMKLADAKYEYEEKNAALERMRTELEAYLGLKASDSIEEDSVESELHSIELNMDSLRKSNKWSFGNEGSAEDSRRASVEEMFKGRRSLGEKIQWENICLQRKTSGGLDWDLTMSLNNRKENANILVKAEDCSRPQSPLELGDSKSPSVEYENNDGGI